MLLLLAVLAVPALCHTCRHTLGLSDGTIKDSQISASSSFSPRTVGPSKARLGTERGGGAWCPASLLTPETGDQEWIQVDLERDMVVEGVMVQGRYAGGQGQEFAEFVRILVWDSKEEDWQVVRDNTSSLVIRANKDTHSKVQIFFKEPVITSMVRIVPVSKHPRMVCLRVELLGCHIQSQGNNFGLENYFCVPNIC